MRIFALLVIICLFNDYGNCQNSLPKSSKDSITKLKPNSKAIDNQQSPHLPERNNQSFEWVTLSNFIAFLALLTSLASAWISYYTFRLQRTHNIKSVKPILHVGQWDYENNLCVTLKNCGAGVAIIKKYSVYSVLTDETRKNLYAWLPPKLGADVNYSKYWTPDTDFVLQPAEVIDLVKIPIDDKKPEQIEERERLRAMLSKLVVQLEYEDIYENKMTLYKRDLAFFSRKDNVNKSIIF
jgi:hypothetical protein